MYISRLLEEFNTIGNALFSVMDTVIDWVFMRSIKQLIDRVPILNVISLVLPSEITSVTIAEFILGGVLPFYILVSVIKFFVEIFK